MARLVRQFIMIIAAVLLTVACKDEARGKLYQLSAEQMFEKLLDKKLTEPTKAKRYTEVGKYKFVSYEEGKSVTWSYSYGREIHRHRATIVPVNDTSVRVVVDLFPSGQFKNLPEMSKKMSYGKEAERIYSFLDGRPFSDKKVSNYALAYILTNPAKVSSDINKLAEKAKGRARAAGISVPN